MRLGDCRGSDRILVLRIATAPIPELITAEGTVIDGTSEEDKQTTQRVGAQAVDFIRRAADRQLAVVAKRALTPPLEDGEERSVEV